MARLDTLPEASIIRGMKGVVDYYVHRGIPCARKWPVMPRRTPSAAERATQEQFTVAIKAWPLIAPDLQALYNNMAAGTKYTGRDMFVRSYLTGVTQLVVSP